MNIIKSMTKKELIEYIKTKSKYVQNNITEKDLINKAINYSEKLDLESCKTIKDIKDMISKYNDNDSVYIKADLEYYFEDNSSASLTSDVSIKTKETDEQLVSRVLDKIKRVEKKEKKLLKLSSQKP